MPWDSWPLKVTSRTTTLNSVSHSSFALRFSDLAEIEAGCREGEEQRAIRTIDWIGARVSRRCAKWVEDMERAEAKAEGKEIQRTPWWDEVKRCTEGDHIPSKTEGWNHPVAGMSPCSCQFYILRFNLSSRAGCLYHGSESAASNHSSSCKASRIPSLG